MMTMLCFSRFGKGCFGFLGTPTDYHTEDGITELFVGDRIQFFYKGDRHDISSGTIVEEKGVFKVADEALSMFPLIETDVISVLTSYVERSPGESVERVFTVEDISEDE